MGWTYNTANPDAETNAPTIAAVGVVFTSLSFILVALRIYVRAFMVKNLGAGRLCLARTDILDERILIYLRTDDWIIVPTWFMSFGFLIVTLLRELLL